MLTYHHLSPPPVVLRYKKYNSVKLERIIADIKDMYYFTQKIAQQNYHKHQNTSVILD